MNEKIVKLLSLQIDRLDSKDFDLEAWKSGTVAVIGRFFGESDARIKQVEDLKIDYSSWALRDSNSKYNPIETCKKKGKAILEAAIDEVEVLGLEPKNNESPIDKIKGIVEEEKFKNLESDESREKTLSSLKKSQLIKMLEKLLSN